MFKRSATKSRTNDDPLLQSSPMKPVAIFEDSNNFLCQLNQAQAQHYLQLPIKVEPQNSSIFNTKMDIEPYSQDHSQNESVKSIREEFHSYLSSTVEEMRLVNNQFTVFDMIEQIIANINLEEAPNKNMPQLNPDDPQAIHQPKVPMVDENLFNLCNFKGSTDQLKKLLLGLINDYQAYDQSLKITMNYHGLQRRDFLLKMFGNILGVVSRENKKMEGGLCVELKKAGFGVEKKAEEEKKDVIEQESASNSCKALFKAAPEDSSGDNKSESLFYEDEE